MQDHQTSQHPAAEAKPGPTWNAWCDLRTGRTFIAGDASAYDAAEQAAGADISPVGQALAGLGDFIDHCQREGDLLAEAEAHAKRDPRRRKMFDHHPYRQVRPLVVRWAAQARTACPRERRRPAPVRTRGSRRTGASSATSGSDPGDPDDEPGPPGLGLWWHPRFGSANPKLLRALLLAEREGVR